MPGVCWTVVQRRGQFREGTISWENFVFKEGGKFFPLRNLGVSAGVGAHARAPAACPPRAVWGEWGAPIRLWLCWALLECCLGGRTVRPRGGAPVPRYAAAGRVCIRQLELGDSQGW